VKIEQHVAMANLLFGHLVVHLRRVGIGGAKCVGEGAVDTVVLVLIGNRQRQDFLLA
jgi:hypothetical protein